MAFIIAFLSAPEEEADCERNESTEEMINVVSVFDEVINAFECRPNNSGFSSSGN